MNFKAPIVFASVALLAAGVCLAQTAPVAPAANAGGANFADHKAKILSNIDQRAAALSTLRSCVSAAADPASVKTCEQQHHAAMQALHPRH
jgi:hypothetical protein